MRVVSYRLDFSLLLWLLVVNRNVVGANRCLIFFLLQAEDGIRDLVRSRGLGDVYKRQGKRLVRPQQRRLR